MILSRGDVGTRFWDAGFRGPFCKRVHTPKTFPKGVLDTLIRKHKQSASFFCVVRGKFFASPPPCHSERSRTFGLVPKARGLPSGISAVVWDVRYYHCLSARSLLDALRRLARTKHIVARLARRRRAVVRVIDAQYHRDPCSHCINIEF